MITLYEAIHNTTGLKYFGVTRRYDNIKDLQKYYHGSGSYWKRHLKKYGDDVTMSIFYQSNNKDIIIKIALMYSRFWNIVTSSKYANLIIEQIDNSNWQKKHTQEVREKMSIANKGRYPSIETKKKMSEAQKLNPVGWAVKGFWTGRKHTEEGKKNISKNHADVSGEKNSQYGMTGEKSTLYGKKMYNNGEINKYFKLGEEPNGFILGKIKKD